MSRPIPAQKVPALDLPIVGGGSFCLSDSQPKHFTMLLFYRGYHCPICKGQLLDLQSRLDELSELGVRPVAISMDSPGRAEKTKTEWELSRLDIAHSLSEAKAREYGLYVTAKVSDKEPDIFAEPGLFLVDAEQKLYFASVQSMPFTRPSLDELIPALGYVTKSGYPARGTLT